MLLSLDKEKLGAEVRFEAAAPVGDAPPPDTTQLFPHLVRRGMRPLLTWRVCCADAKGAPPPALAQYGPIPAAAVTEETAVDRTPSGKFLGILWGIAVIHSRADWLKLGAS